MLATACAWLQQEAHSHFEVTSDPDESDIPLPPQMTELKTTVVYVP